MWISKLLLSPVPAREADSVTVAVVMLVKVTVNGGGQRRGPLGGPLGGPLRGQAASPRGGRRRIQS